MTNAVLQPDNNPSLKETKSGELPKNPELPKTDTIATKSLSEAILAPIKDYSSIFKMCIVDLLNEGKREGDKF